MIRDIDNQAELLIDVLLESGEMYKSCDVPSAPFGEEMNVVSFWHGDKLHIVPMAKVVKCAIFVDKSKE